jgi:hypothetical protein
MGVGIARIDHEGYPLQAGHCLFQERHALAGEIAMHQREAGHVAARTSEALNQLGGDGVGGEYEYHRRRAGDPL